MIGGLVFSYATAPLFDSHVKEFRLFADLINDAGLTLDMVAPYFGADSILAVASAAGLCKALCGISAGATKGSITLHFALEGNMADLNAKESTQETLVSLIGMLLGVALARQLRHLEEVGHYEAERIVQVQWFVFVSLTILHIWANWRGVTLLRMRTLNRERTELVLEYVLDELTTKTTQKLYNDARLGAAIEGLPSPADTRESLLSSIRKMLWPGRLRLSASLADVLACFDDVETIREFDSERYVLALNGHDEVLVSLLTGARAKDQLKAFVHALCLIRCTADGQASPRSNGSTSYNALSKIRGQELIRQTEKHVNDDLISSLMEELKRKGWEVEDRLYLGFSRRRSRWTLDKTE